MEDSRRIWLEEILSKHPDLGIIPPKQAKEKRALTRSLWTGELGHKLLALIKWWLVRCRPVAMEYEVNK
jgi:hypothetical protein